MLEDTVVLRTVGEEGDLGRKPSTLGCSSSWLSTGDVWSLCWEAGRGALTQRTGGSTQVRGGVCVAGFMEGSGVRSEGGMRSGLEDLDLSTDFKPVEAGDVSTA